LSASKTRDGALLEETAEDSDDAEIDAVRLMLRLMRKLIRIDAEIDKKIARIFKKPIKSFENQCCDPQS
jgi:hypothetical protein